MQQHAVHIGVLGHEGAFITAHELHRRVHRLGSPIGMSTVYGVLRDLVKRDLVDVMVGEHIQRSYRRCSSRPHHHPVCSACHATIEIPAHSSPLPAWVPEVALGLHRRARPRDHHRNLRRVHAARSRCG
ncbi:transcriptional repressor [Lentzea terrae]|uniref:transcriptional repressor n=1 Tax=Lentzea terrae TaxID=2200761 RepID=UPI0013002EE5